MTNTTLSRRSPVPLYYQLESLLRDEIAAGRYDGGPLPTEEALTRRFGVSRITVRRAMDRLVQEGRIYRVPGRGTFVHALGRREVRIERNLADLMGFEADLRRAGFEAQTRVLRHEWVPAPEDVVAALDAPADIEVLWLHRRGDVDGQPLWVEDRYVLRPWAGWLRPRDYAAPGVLSTLAAARGVAVDRGRVRLSARPAGREEARLLRLRAGAPVLVGEFAVWTAEAPAQFVRARFRADRYAFTVTVEPRDAGRRDAAHGETARHAAVRRGAARRGATGVVQEGHRERE